MLRGLEGRKRGCFGDPPPPCRFGNPFILYLERTVTWDGLQKEILEKMRHVLRTGAAVQARAVKRRQFLHPPTRPPACDVAVLFRSRRRGPSRCAWWGSSGSPISCLRRSSRSAILPWRGKAARGPSRSTAVGVSNLDGHFCHLDSPTATGSKEPLLFNRAYKSCGAGGPPHVKIVAEWDKETKDS